jgi:hypothetical protein
MAKLKIKKTSAINNVTYPQSVVDAFVSPIVINGSHIGGTGGDVSQSGQQMSPTVKVGTNAASSGSIIKQKGAHKFRVQDASANRSDCKLVNLATPTASNTMSLAITLSRLGFANVVAQGSATTSTYVTYATANIAGPVAVAVGQTITGTGITGAVTVTAINSTIAGLANLTVGFSSQTVTAQPNTTVAVTAYASRINNKFVWDFGSDGSAVSSTSGNFTGTGFNPNRYRYHLAAPDATFVQVASV